VTVERVTHHIDEFAAQIVRAVARNLLPHVMTRVEGQTEAGHASEGGERDQINRILDRWTLDERTY
jgi:hypothetical protein